MSAPMTTKQTASVVEWQKSMFSDPVTSLAWVRSLGGDLLVWCKGKEVFLVMLVRKLPAYITEIQLNRA